ncbi:hypothetical protein KPL71_015310 [Citrus sinensis]|uniref:Uncharacterized protein n=1 Tax=Citrus sinensis TaxID=2711 RepID=A0ACB8KI74_CITSI|nr:hypothetical protein KPL71_015310 [Citrus sinensis]
MLPGIDISSQLGFTPLTISPEGHYYVTLPSIRINNKQVPTNASSLKVNINAGAGGTKIITIKPYIVLEQPIYQSFTKFFTSQLLGIPKLAKPVAPFSLCHDSRKLKSTRAGPRVPNRDFVL